MASAVSALSGSSTATDSSQASKLASTAPSQEMFLQLLVAQIKNQDPLNPTDSVQFVSQLAQFSQLEQVIAIRGDIEGQTASSSTSASTATSSTEKATT
jgi:flagellar basal-body rod modification protein FlgD